MFYWELRPRTVRVVSSLDTLVYGVHAQKGPSFEVLLQQVADSSRVYEYWNSEGTWVNFKHIESIDFWLMIAICDSRIEVPRFEFLQRRALDSLRKHADKARLGSLLPRAWSKRLKKVPTSMSSFSRFRIHLKWTNIGIQRVNDWTLRILNQFTLDIWLLYAILGLKTRCFDKILNGVPRGVGALNFFHHVSRTNGVFMYQAGRRTGQGQLSKVN